MRVIPLLCLLLIVAGCGGEPGDETTMAPPTTSMPAEGSMVAQAGVPPIVLAWAEGMVASDADAVIALHTDTAVWEDRASRTTNEGSEAIAQHLAVGFAFADFETMEPTAVTMSDDIITVEWIWSGMSSVVARGPDDKTPFTTVAITEFHLERDLIALSILDYPYSDLFN